MDIHKVQSCIIVGCSCPRDRRRIVHRPKNSCVKENEEHKTRLKAFSGTLLNYYEVADFVHVFVSLCMSFSD